MESDEGAGEVQPQPQDRFMSVDLAFDHESQWLKAHVNETTTNPNITLNSLKEMLKSKDWEYYQVPDKALNELMLRIEALEPGVVNLAPKPTFTSVELEIDPQTQSLSAILAQSDTPQEITPQSLQAWVQDKYQEYEVTPEALQHVLQKVAKQEFGVYDLGVKATYINAELSYDAKTREVMATLVETPNKTELSLEGLKDKLKTLSVDNLQLDEKKAQTCLASAKQKKTGDFVIAHKPEYTDIHLLFNEETGELTVDFVASETEPNLSLENFLKAIEAKGFSNFFFEPDYEQQFEKYLEDHHRGEWVIAQRLDAKVIIQVADDHMSATLATQPAFGGKDLTRNYLEVQIKNAGLSFDLVDHDILEKALATDALEPTLFIQGKEPIKGDDAAFESLVQSIISYAPEIDDKGKANFLQTRDYVIVEPNTPLMRRTSAMAGKNGVDVFGKVVPAQPGDDIPFSDELTGVKVDPKDPNMLISTMKGHPIVLEQGVTIDNVLVIDNVDLKTGNVSFDGSVIIKGKIASGMVVHVTGDVRVQEPINNATIIAGHDIIIESGIIGDKNDDDEEVVYQAQLSAGGDVYANFITRTQVHAKGNVEIREYISHSLLEVQGKLMIGQDGGKGQLLGGLVQAKRGVVVNTLGAPAHVKTEVIVGYSAQLRLEHRRLKADYQDLAKSFAQCHFNLYKLSNLDKESLNQETQVKIDQLKESIKAKNAELTELSNRLDECESQITAYKDARIVVMKTTHPNVFLEIGGARCSIDDESGPAEYIRVQNKVEKKV